MCFSQKTDEKRSNQNIKPHMKNTKYTPGTYYHLFNRANGWEQLFRSEDNYNYFLRRYIKYMSPVCSTYAYCLLPNHFHFLVRIHDAEELRPLLPTHPDLRGFGNLEGLGEMEEEASRIQRSNTRSVGDLGLFISFLKEV